jgi:mannose-1-phosphate guanylyltransferase
VVNLLNLLTLNLQDTYIVIQAAGLGTRMWPLSKTNKPKQFYDLLSQGKSMLQMTFERFSEFVPRENIFVITHDSYASLVTEQLPFLSPGNLILEPLRKNTAPGFLYAIKKIQLRNPQALILQSNCDFYTNEGEKFANDIKKMISYSRENACMMVMGVKPASLEPTFGFIQIQTNQAVTDQVFPVKTFADSAIPELITTFIRSGEFLWNTSLFCAPLSYLFKTYEEHAPDLLELFQDSEKWLNTKKEKSTLNKIYPLCRNVAFRFEILYKQSKAFCFVGNFDFKRVINFNHLWEAHEKDYLGNAVNGSNVIVYNTSNSTILAPDRKLVVVDGLEGYIVVDSEDALLIAPKGDEEKLKNVYNDIKRLKGEKFT